MFVDIQKFTNSFILQSGHSLSVTCDRSVVFSWYSVSFTNKADRQNIVESGVKHYKTKPIKQWVTVTVMIVIIQNEIRNVDDAIIRHSK